nr:MAG TPA: YopX protein [Caudoviricetes sp.]
MREILFKAKRVKNGEWIEGSLIDLDIDSGYCYIVPPYKQASTLPIGFLITDGMELVIPETLCQFTGLCDKNGKKIWENDILMAHLDESYPEDVAYETVEWGVAGWVAHETGSMDREYLGEFDLEHYEVVGNIFDNKELLQEETNE